MVSGETIVPSSVQSAHLHPGPPHESPFKLIAWDLNTVDYEYRAVDIFSIDGCHSCSILTAVSVRIVICDTHLQERCQSTAADSFAQTIVLPLDHHAASE